MMTQERFSDSHRFRELKENHLSDEGRSVEALLDSMDAHAVDVRREAQYELVLKLVGLAVSDYRAVSVGLTKLRYPSENCGQLAKRMNMSRDRVHVLLRKAEAVFPMLGRLMDSEKSRAQSARRRREGKA